MEAEAAKGASKTFCFADAETMDDAANNPGEGDYGLDENPPQHKQGDNVAGRKNGTLTKQRCSGCCERAARRSSIIAAVQGNPTCRRKPPRLPVATYLPSSAFNQSVSWLVEPACSIVWNENLYGAPQAS
jgi:hypothetical protein